MALLQTVMTLRPNVQKMTGSSIREMARSNGPKKGLEFGLADLASTSIYSQTKRHTRCSPSGKQLRRPGRRPGERRGSVWCISNNALSCDRMGCKDAAKLD